jgi:hypothetical protein
MADLLADLPADYDPLPSARKLVRHRQSGDLGYLVKRSGKLMVRLDRPAQEILRKYSTDEWADEEQVLPLAKIHAARVAFEADKALCGALSMHKEARREWMKLPELERHRWMSVGPAAPLSRSALYRSVMAALAPYVR